MRVSYKWLGELVEGLPDVALLAERLTMGGIEVEAIHAPELDYGDRLVVARIVTREQHPNADRLTACTVDDGGGELLSIVCGAKNHKAGDLAVLARPGCVLPGGVKIGKSRLRGVESEGMLCSAKELGIDADGEGIVILEQGLVPGSDAAALLGLDDTILELAITPNRGDCLSMFGLAREAAALCGLRVKEMAPTAGLPSGQGPVRVEIRDSARCPLYTGLAMRSVRIGPSPAWLRTRLAACGLRSINNVVDVTNLVLMERGQPLHAFDRSKIGGGRIVVRFAQRGEKIRTLDEREIVLADEDLVIADQALPVAVAGVMGGADSAVLDSTTQIFLESALFLPSTVRRTSRRHAMITDSSYRFERGVDPGAVEAALERAASLLTQVAGAEAEGGIVREGPGAAARPAVRVRPSRVEAILGTPVADARIGEVLGAIGAAPMHDGDAFVAEPPGHRQDLEREIDFIEEIARIVGYEAIAPALPQVALTPTLLPESVRAAAELRRVLSALGFHEHVAVSFTSEAANARFRGPFDDGASVLVRNPLRSDATALQRSALGALLDALKTNVAARAPRVDLFTIARTFAACGSPQVEQREVVSGLLYGRRPGVLARDERPLVFADVKRVVESLLAVLAPGRSLSFAATDARAEYHPRACAEARLDGQVVGYFGRLHPDVAEGAEIAGEIYVWEVDCREAVAYRRAHPGLQPIPRYPGSERDVSLLVDARTPAAAAVEAVQALGEPAIESITVFDEYTGAGIDSGRKALGYRIVYRAADRTLTEAEVSALHETVLGHLTRRLGATVRV